MRRFLCLTALLPLSACGWWDGAFAPYSYGNPADYGVADYSQRYGAAPRAARGPGFYDRRTPKGQLALEGGAGFVPIAGGTLIDPNRARGGFPVGNKRTYEDVYKTGSRLSVSATYPRPAQSRYFTATAYRTNHSGSNISFVATNRAPVTGRLSDYTAHGVEFGLRQYSDHSFGPAHPFVEGRIGGAYIDDISIQGPVRTTRLFGSGWVPTASALIGVEAPAYNQFTVGIDAGLSYQGRLGADESGLAQNVLGGARRSGSMIATPVTLRGRYRF